MIKLIATDLDGTLLDENSKVPKDFNTTLEKLLNKNIIFAVASGRSYAGIEHLFTEDVIEKLYFICDNGAVVQKGKEVLFSYKIEKEQVKRIITFLRENNINNIMVSGVKGAYYEASNEDFSNKMKNMYTEMTLVEDILKVDDEIFKISVYDKEDIKDKVYTPIKNEFKDELSIHIAAKIWTDIMQKGTDKGIAIDILQKKYNIHYDETMVFCDYNNDIPMINMAKYSVAMDNATEEVKDICFMQTTKNSQNGVIKTINEYILNK